MKTPNIQITESDYNKLQDLLRELDASQKIIRETLAQELLRARVTPSDEIAPDVITLNSRARLRDLENGDVLEFAIVLPEYVDVEGGRISILAPLGMAMLGYREGDTFEWEMPGGPGRFLVEKVLFQPEAAEKAT
jgi:regulator of nucleoside diphosphate kinase